MEAEKVPQTSPRHLPRLNLRGPEVSAEFELGSEKKESVRHKESRSAQANLNWGLWVVGKELTKLPRGPCVLGTSYWEGMNPRDQNVGLAVFG